MEKNYFEYDDVSPVKEAAIKFDILIRDGGIGASLFFILLILIIVNAHSLHFLFGDGTLNWIFSITGAIGFSVATMAVIRKPVANWMKYVFPLFDTILVFLGFNILDGMPVRGIMIIVFSLFTGAILISLGTINFHENNHLEQEKQKDAEIGSLKLTIKRLETSLESDKERSMSLKERLNQITSEMETYKRVYLQSEKSRILKKKPVNRTRAENELLIKINEDGNT
jgi:hypothetical protein